MQSHYFTTTLYIYQCLYHLHVVDYCLIWSLPARTTHAHILCVDINTPYSTCNHTHAKSCVCLYWHWRGRKNIFRQCRKGTTCRYAKQTNVATDTSCILFCMKSTKMARHTANTTDAIPRFKAVKNNLIHLSAMAMLIVGGSHLCIQLYI